MNSDRSVSAYRFLTDKGNSRGKSTDCNSVPTFSPRLASDFEGYFSADALCLEIVGQLGDAVERIEQRAPVILVQSTRHVDAHTIG